MRSSVEYAQAPPARHNHPMPPPAPQSAGLGERATPPPGGAAVLRGRESREPLGRPGRLRRSASARRFSAAAAADGGEGAFRIGESSDDPPRPSQPTAAADSSLSAAAAARRVSTKCTTSCGRERLACRSGACIAGVDIAGRHPWSASARSTKEQSRCKRRCEPGAGECGGVGEPGRSRAAPSRRST